MSVDRKLDKIIDCLYRIAVKAVIIRDAKVLLVKDGRDIGWTFPGGGVDHGEGLSEAMVRELSEEIGVAEKNITVDKNIVGVFIGHVKAGVPRCNIHFKVFLATNEVKPTEEVTDVAWVSIDDLNNESFDLSAGNKEDVIKLVKSLA